MVCVFVDLKKLFSFFLLFFFFLKRKKLFSFFLSFFFSKIKTRKKMSACTPINAAVVCNDGNIFTWGGRHPTVSYTVSKPVQQIVCDNGYTFALFQDGTLATFTNGDPSCHTQPPEFPLLKQIACGYAQRGIFALCEKDGKMIQGGHDEEQSQTLDAFFASLPPVRSFACAHEFFICVFEDGTTGAYGCNTDGIRDIPADLPPVKEFFCSHVHVVALCEDTSVRCWGYNEYGQCDIPHDLFNVKQVACGLLFTALLFEDGRVQIFGQKTARQGLHKFPKTNMCAIYAKQHYLVGVKEDGSVQRCVMNDNIQDRLKESARAMYKLPRGMPTAFTGQSDRLFLLK
jgi:alpha-tubulin suppressor-like RCC1 family protein